MTPHVEVLIAGAGFSGLGAAIELRRRGRRGFRILEASNELGGVWRDNTYPGVAVDVPSISYCYSFETDFRWSREFAPGAEIHAYLKHCADKYELAEHIQFNARIVRSSFDASRDIWSTELANGDVITSRYLIAATGQLSTPKLLDIPGLDLFGGKTMHTARWDHHHDLRSQNVAVIGTGASAVQVIPAIAPMVAQLTVFQRTPIWVGPRLDRPIKRRGSAARWLLRLASESAMELLTFFIVNFSRFPFVVRLIDRMVRGWMRRQVDDPTTAAKLLPSYELGCKHTTTSNTYLNAFNRDNVVLVTDPITRICREGIVTGDNELHAIDTLILATGFLTTERGNTPSFEVIGTDGVELGRFWDEHRHQAFGGVSVPGFPNFFLTLGPYTGGFNQIAAIEASLSHVMASIDAARERGATRVEVRREAHEQYMRNIWKRAEGTVFVAPSCASARSFYIDRHGDASVPSPHTPLWRAMRSRVLGTQGYHFTQSHSSR